MLLSNVDLQPILFCIRACVVGNYVLRTCGTSKKKDCTSLGDLASYCECNTNKCSDAPLSAAFSRQALGLITAFTVLFTAMAV